jgi:Heparinase II/III-like protein/Heparinase II/III N-terminus
MSSFSIGQLTTTSMVAAFVAFALMGFVRNAFAGHLDIEAYDIAKAAKPGPVEEFQPIKSLPPVHFQLPFDWGMDPFDDLSWQNSLHKLRHLLDAALAAGDFPYARAVFRDWQLWHNGREARSSWGDAVTGARAARLAYLLHSTGWRDRRLIRLAERHAAKLQDPDFLSTTNHAIAQLHGLAALCLDDELRSCRGAQTFLERQLHVLLRHQFARSGVHRENSPGYHFYALDHLSRMAPILNKYSADFAQTITRAEKLTRWLVHPDLTTVAMSDSKSVLRPNLQFPPGDASCDGIQSYSEAPTCYMLRHFRDVGYVIVRSDWAIPSDEASMLFIQGGFFNTTHRQADDFSFEWFEHGRKILSDSGHYGYSRDKWQRYFESTRAHNTIEVDGRNYSSHDGGRTYGNAVRGAQRTTDGMRIILQINHDDLGFWHRRQIDYHPGEELRIKDSVRSDHARTYVQWHHFAPAFGLSGSAQSFELDDGEMLVELTTSTSCGDETRYQKIRGQLEPRIQGWVSLAERQRDERWALGVECHARDATLEALYKVRLM